MLCALIVPNCNQVWQLGIIHSIKPDSDVIEIYVWQGGTVLRPDCQIQDVKQFMYPAFYSKTYDNMMNQSINDNFEPLQLDMSTIEIFFI